MKIWILGCLQNLNSSSNKWCHLSLLIVLSNLNKMELINNLVRGLKYPKNRNQNKKLPGKKWASGSGKTKVQSMINFNSTTAVTMKHTPVMNNKMINKFHKIARVNHPKVKKRTYIQVMSNSLTMKIKKN